MTFWMRSPWMRPLFFNSRSSNPRWTRRIWRPGGSDNPVYYVAVAHARICSLIAKLAEEGAAVPAAGDVDAALLVQPEEKALLKALSMLPEEIRLAARDYDPSRINRYLVELSGDFHRFYNACRIREEAPALRDARLKLADTTRAVIAGGLGLLGVSARKNVTMLRVKSCALPTVRRSFFEHAPQKAREKSG